MCEIIDLPCWNWAKDNRDQLLDWLSQLRREPLEEQEELSLRATEAALRRTAPR